MGLAWESSPVFIRWVIIKHCLQPVCGAASKSHIGLSCLRCPGALTSRLLASFTDYPPPCPLQDKIQAAWRLQGSSYFDPCLFLWVANPFLPWANWTTRGHLKRLPCVFLYLDPLPPLTKEIPQVLKYPPLSCLPQAVSSGATLLRPHPPFCTVSSFRVGTGFGLSPSFFQFPAGCLTHSRHQCKL